MRSGSSPLHDERLPSGCRKPLPPPCWSSAMPRLRSILTGSASRYSGHSLAVTVPDAAPIASSTGSTRTAALSTSSTLTTVRRSTTALSTDDRHSAPHRAWIMPNQLRDDLDAVHAQRERVSLPACLPMRRRQCPHVAVTDSSPHPSQPHYRHSGSRADHHVHPPQPALSGASGRVTWPPSAPVTWADAPGVGHRLLQDRGSHSGAFGPSRP